MKKLLSLMSLLMTVILVQSQNKQVLYGFDEIPQTMLLNPGMQPSYKYHIGIPVLSGLSAELNSSELTIADLFKNDNIDFTTKVRNAISNITVDDYITINQQIEILSGSYRLNKRDFLSAGFYTEIDIFASLPKDFVELIIDGNASNLNRPFLASQVNVKAEALSVLHAGISRKINNDFTVGGRLKIYSGIANAMSTNNSGTFTTRQGQNNIYTHYLNNVNITGYSSGFSYEDDVTASTFIGKAFLGGNLGLGFDVGFTYNIDNQTEITGSILDIGFVSYSQDIKNGTIKGDYTFSGIEFQYDSNNTDYWQNLRDDFDAQVPREENEESYTVMRPIKINGSYRYSWGKSRNLENCSDTSYKGYFNNAVGAQIFTVMRPTGPKFALTGFYESKLLEGLNTKVTYTIDDYSATNIGLGLSAKVGKFHVYGTVDNVFGLTDIASANRASFQFGMNLIFN